MQLVSYLVLNWVNWKGNRLVQMLEELMVLWLVLLMENKREQPLVIYLELDWGQLMVYEKAMLKVNMMELLLDYVKEYMLVNYLVIW